VTQINAAWRDKAYEFNEESWFGTPMPDAAVAGRWPQRCEWGGKGAAAKDGIASDCRGMDEVSKNQDPSFCEVSLRKIDAALSSTMGAMLSLDQFDEVTRLRRLIRQFCEQGRQEEAQAAVDAAMAILRPRLIPR